MKSAVKVVTGSKVGSVGKTAPKQGLKSGAKQTDGNKMFKNVASNGAKKAIKVVHGKSGLPSGATAKGRGVFSATVQPKDFSNDLGVMKGNGCTRFVN